MNDQETQPLNLIEQIPELINQLPAQLLKEAPRLVEKWLDDNSNQKLAQIEFQKLQLEVNKQQIEHNILVSKQDHALRMKNNEVLDRQNKSNSVTQLQGLIFKIIVYSATLSVFTYLSMQNKMSEILSTVFGISALSVLGLDVTGFLKNANNRDSNNSK